MEQAFQMVYLESNKVFYISPTNWKGEEEFIANHIYEWDFHWKVMNASFEEAFNSNVVCIGSLGECSLCGMITIDYKLTCHIFQEFN
jgi:hypothetical protein